MQHAKLICANDTEHQVEHGNKKSAVRMMYSYFSWLWLTLMLLLLAFPPSRFRHAYLLSSLGILASIGWLFSGIRLDRCVRRKRIHSMEWITNEQHFSMRTAQVYVTHFEHHPYSHKHTIETVNSVKLHWAIKPFSKHIHTSWFDWIERAMRMSQHEYKYANDFYMCLSPSVCVRVLTNGHEKKRRKKVNFKTLSKSVVCCL